MSGSRVIAFFDFDGTITTKDIFGDFIRYRLKNGLSKNRIIQCLPVMLLYTCRLITNSTAKKRVFSKLFKGTKEGDFKKWADYYSSNILPSYLRKSAIQQIEWHKAEGHEVFIVSANFDLILQPFASLNEVGVISTELEIFNGLLTGNFATPNCYGIEKVTRIKKLFDLEAYSSTYAYGDSNGDTDMLMLATNKFYRYFT